MTVTERFDAVIFDLDGTLIDSAPDLRVAANALLAAAGRRSLSHSEAVAMIGDGMPVLIERAFAATGAPVDPAAMPGLVEHFLAVYQDPARPHLTTVAPGAAAALAALKKAGCRLGLCTNKFQAPAENVLADLGLADLFDAVVGGDRAPARKPDPAHLLAVLDRLGVPPGRAVMVGDSGNDVRAARGAGVPVVVVSFGYTREPAADLGADAVIDGYEELAVALARFR